MQGCSVRPPRQSDHLEIGCLPLVDEVARLAVVAQDRMQAAAGLKHDSDAVLAGVGVFPSHDSLTCPGGVLSPEDHEQTAIHRDAANDLQQGFAVESDDCVRASL